MRLTRIFSQLFSVLALGHSFEAQAQSYFKKMPENTEGLIPAYMIDHSGFELPKELVLKRDGMDVELPPVPMFPVSRGNEYSKTFIGTVVLPEYLGFKDGSCSPYTMSYEQKDFLSLVIRRMSGMKTLDGIGLNPFFDDHSCRLYGFRSDYDLVLETTRSTGWGIKIGFGGGYGSKTIVFKRGSSNFFGFNASINFGQTILDSRDKRGINLAKGLQNFIDGIDLIANGEGFQSYLQKTIDFTAFSQFHIAQNAEATPFVGPLGPYKANLNQGLVLPAPAPQVAPVQRISPDLLSDEFNRLNKELREKQKLKREKQWRKDLENYVHLTPVWADAGANAIIQSVCDRLAETIDFPKDIWPKCRIAATWQPNAYAFPGGDIFITAGLLGILSDLDSVQFVLGHELGHVLARHTTRRVPGINLINYSASTIALAYNLAGAAFALSGGMGFLGEVTWLTFFPQVFGASMAAIPASQVMNLAMQIIYFGPIAGLMANSRSHEWQSDRVGHQLALGIGSDQQGIVRGWNQFRTFLEDNFSPPEGFLNKIMASHPNAQDREESLKKRKIFVNLIAPSGIQNRFSSQVFDDYSDIHELLKHGVQAFAAEIKAKKQKGDSRAWFHALETLKLDGGQCILHSLSDEN